MANPTVAIITLFTPETLQQHEQAIGASHLTWTSLNLLGSKPRNMDEAEDEVIENSLVSIVLCKNGSPKVIGCGSISNEHGPAPIPLDIPQCYGATFPYDYFARLDRVVMFEEPIELEEYSSKSFNANMQVEKSVFGGIRPITCKGTANAGAGAWGQVHAMAVAMWEDVYA